MGLHPLRSHSLETSEISPPRKEFGELQSQKVTQIFNEPNNDVVWLLTLLKMSHTQFSTLPLILVP